MSSYKKSDYARKLADPRWQKRRLEILNRDNFTCTDYMDKTTELHVHHRYYIKGREPWDYPGFALKTLCKPCHDGISEQRGIDEERRGWDEWEMVVNTMTNELPDQFFDAVAAAHISGASRKEIAERLLSALSEISNKQAVG